MATVYDDLIKIAEEVAEMEYRNAEKEIELPNLRIRTPEPKSHGVYEPFSDDESDGEDESPYRCSLEDFLRPDAMSELLEWLTNYPSVFVRVDEEKGVFYMTGMKRTLKRMAKHPMHQVMLDTIMDMYCVHKISIMPLDWTEWKRLVRVGAIVNILQNKKTKKIKNSNEGV